MKSLATWIMNRIADDDSSNWTLAMRREFDELDNGHLLWALGCLGLAVRRDLWQNWKFLCAVVLCAFFLVVPYPMLMAFLPREFLVENFYKLAIFAPVPFALLLGWLKPDRVLTVGILGGLIGQGLGGVSLAVIVAGWTWKTALVDTVWMDTLPTYLGIVVQTAIWLAAAYAGATIRKLRPSRQNA